MIPLANSSEREMGSFLVYSFVGYGELDGNNRLSERTHELCIELIK